MTLFRLISVLLAALVASPCLADTGSAHASLGVHLKIVSACRTQYTLFGPQASNQISVICSPSTTPFAMFSNLMDSVTSMGGVNLTTDPNTAADNQEDSTAFSISSTPFAPHSHSNAAVQGQKTRVVHVTF